MDNPALVTAYNDSLDTVFAAAAALAELFDDPTVEALDAWADAEPGSAARTAAENALLARLDAYQPEVDRLSAALAAFKSHHADMHSHVRSRAASGSPAPGPAPAGPQEPFTAL